MESLSKLRKSRFTCIASSLEKASHLKWYLALCFLIGMNFELANAGERETDQKVKAFANDLFKEEIDRVTLEVEGKRYAWTSDDFSQETPNKESFIELAMQDSPDTIRIQSDDRKSTHRVTIRRKATVRTKSVPYAHMSLGASHPGVFPWSDSAQKEIAFTAEVAVGRKNEAPIHLESTKLRLIKPTLAEVIAFTNGNQRSLLSMEESIVFDEFEALFNRTFHPSRNHLFYGIMRGHYPRALSSEYEVKPACLVELAGQHQIWIEPISLTSIEKANGYTACYQCFVSISGLRRQVQISFADLKKSKWTDWEEPKIFADRWIRITKKGKTEIFLYDLDIPVFEGKVDSPLSMSMKESKLGVWRGSGLRSDNLCTGTFEEIRASYSGHSRDEFLDAKNLFPLGERIRLFGDEAGFTRKKGEGNCAVASKEQLESMLESFGHQWVEIPLE